MLFINPPSFRLEYKRKTLEENIIKLKEAELDIESKLKKFDEESNLMKKKLDYQWLKSRISKISNKNTSLTYLQSPSFEFPTFKWLNQEIEMIKEMGKIRDNRVYDLPIVIFNTYNFEMLEYNNKHRKFKETKVRDEENIISRIPKYFKSLVVSEDEVVILGGSEEIPCKSRKKKYEVSNKGFRITKGKIYELKTRMYKARQHFSIAFDKLRKQVFVIGGYNENQGTLASWEKLSLSTHKFTRIASMKQARLNWASTIEDNKYIYVFNGVGLKQDLDTIERYSINLNYWESLKITTPFRVHNNFAVDIGMNEIAILGGIQNWKGTKGPQRTVTAVFIFNTLSHSFKEMPRLAYNHKIGSVKINNRGELLCYLPHNKR